MLTTTFLDSTFGLWKISGSEKGVNSIRLMESLPSTFKVRKLPAPVKEAEKQLKEYFDKEREAFDIKLDLSSHSEFYQKVWAELQKVPYAHTTSYLAIAQQVGDRNAVRAVGQANRNNPIAIVIPCHRCIALNGNLQGYFYGLDFKERLLAHENPMSFAQQGQLF